ncbi:MAG: Bug family tripartite tricarboxylate transporter substrate binding protein [Xanthobacteraceae bacterium]
MKHFTTASRLARILGFAAFGLCGIDAASSSVLAQDFPNRPVKIIVPAAAGGALDAISRLIAQKAQDTWKQTVYVENKPGANWIIGMDAVAKSAPDGYTLLFIASSGLTVNPYVFPNMPLDPLRDLTPVVTATRTAFVLLAHPSVPAKTLPEFIAHLKANPGKLNHASNSSTTMLISELFKQQAKVDYVDVNYRGASNALVATIGGTTQFCFVDLGSGTGPIEGKTLRPLGLTARERYKLRPDIPTIAEQGLPGFAAYSTTLLLAPAKTPPELVQQMSRAFAEALKAPDVSAKLAGMGQIVEPTGPQETAKELLPEAEQWKKLIKERNIKFGS